MIIVLLLLALFTLFQNPGQRSVSNDISYSQLLTEADRGNVTAVSISGNEIKGTYANGGQFSTYLPNDPSLVQRLAAKNVQITEPARAGHLWAQADRVFSDGAAYVPTVSLQHTAFVSARVGNFQNNPHTGPMLDQM